MCSQCTDNVPVKFHKIISYKSISVNLSIENSLVWAILALLPIPRSSSGRTLGFGPRNRGSNPCLGTNKLKTPLEVGVFNLF